MRAVKARSKKKKEKTIMENLAMKMKKNVCQGMQTKMPDESFCPHAHLTVHTATDPTQDQKEGIRSREPCAMQPALVLHSAK